MELVNARNQCDAMVHSVKKSLGEHGDKLGADEKAKIEAALKDAEDVLKKDDKDEIEAKSKALAEASHKLAEKMYAQEQAKQQAAAQAKAGGTEKTADKGTLHKKADAPKKGEKTTRAPDDGKKKGGITATDKKSMIGLFWISCFAAGVVMFLVHSMGWD